MPRTWFNIARNDASGAASIDLFDEIGSYGISAKSFVTQLRALKDVPRIALKIDCPGGDCNDGFTIYDALKASKAEITADIIGCAASMATVIMLAANKIRIAENGRVMVHRVTGGAFGNADELDAATKITKQFEDRIVKLYMARTGADDATVRDWMKAEMGTWFFGEEAVQAKFADELITGIQARAFQPRWAKLFTMLPAALFDTTKRSTNTPIIAMTEAELTLAEDKLKADQAELEKQKATAAADAEKIKADARAEADKLIAEAKKLAETTAPAPANVITLDEVKKMIEETDKKRAEDFKNLEAKIAQGVLKVEGGKPVENVATPGGVTRSLKRSEWTALNALDRAKFIREGGTLAE